MGKKKLHLFENKFYWIASVVTLMTMVPTDRDRIVQYCLCILFGSTIIFSWIDLGSAYIFQCFKNNSTQSSLIGLFSLIHAVVLSRSFNLVWLPSNKLAALAFRFHLSSSQFLRILIIFAFPCIVCTVFVFLSFFLKRYQQSNSSIAEIALALFCSFLTFQIAQGISCGLVGTSGVRPVICGTLIIAIAIALVGAVTASVKASILVGSLPFILFATANYYVYEFRGREICPFDFLSLGTAMNVVSEYRFTLSQYVLFGWMAWVLLMLVLTFKNCKRASSKKRTRIFAGAICILSVLSVFGLARNIPARTWEKGGSSSNGTFLNFLLLLRDSQIRQPENYSSEALQKLEQKYQNSEGNLTSQQPTIIVIMDESFTDFSVLGNAVQTEEPLLPFLSALQENTIRGYAYSSVYGGNTANSEFEFLTGNSMAFLPADSVPYQQYIVDEQYSIVSYLHSLGYYCVATHPYYASGWNRRNVYKYFGFDEQSFISDYPQKNLVRKYVSDQEMFEYIIQRYQNRDKNKGLFIFGITMQNHGGYTYTNFKSSVPLEYESKYPEAEQFLSLANLSDQALKILLDYFSGVQDPVVLCFFGDHQPSVESGFLNAVHGGTFDDLNSRMLKYKVPFFVWANYDIIEQDNIETSINYLSSYLLEVSNLKLPSYNQFLLDTEKQIPVLTAHGYYSRSKKCFLPVSEAEGVEKEILNQYHILEYCNMFDKQKDNPLFHISLQQK